MQRHGIVVDDVFAFILPRQATAQPPSDVHFNAQGYDLLGAHVAQSTLANLRTCLENQVSHPAASSAGLRWRNIRLNP
jgi:hypothetical protein